MAKTETIFKDIKEVIEYLKSEGYKIEKSKAYEDRRYMSPQKDGTFLKAEIDKYAKRFLTKNDASDLTGNAEEKMKWEARIAEQKFRDMELEAKIKQGNYVLRSEVEQMLAGRAAFLKHELGEGFIHSRAGKIAEILKGKKEQTPELIDFWLKQIHAVFDMYSRPMRFEVPASALTEFSEEQ